MYANGQGLTQDNAEAVKWYRLAANQGYADAQVNLGRLRGEGLIMDDADKVQHAPIEEAFGGYGLAIRTFWFDVNDISIVRVWDQKSSITYRPEFISSVNGKAVSEDRVGFIGRDGSVKDFDFTLQVDTNAKESWESLRSFYSLGMALGDQSKYNPEYIGLMKHISERIARPANMPELVECEASGLPAVLKAAEEAGVDLAVVDTRPSVEADTAAVAKLADLVLIPTRPAILDLRAIGATVQVVQAAKRPALIVLNAAPPPRGSTQAAITAEARRALAAYPAPVAPVAIASRAALSHALVGGLAVTEFEPAGKASVEMQALFTIVRKSLWPNARK